MALLLTGTVATALHAELVRIQRVVDEDSVELIVGVNGMTSEGYDRLTELTRNYRGTILNSVYFGGMIEAVVVDLPSSSAFAFADKAVKVARPSYLEPNVKFSIDFVPDDPYWNLQWALNKIEADYAWNKTFGNSSFLVAVIDTGVDWDHPDLAANYVSLGYDWVNDDNDPMDDNGHGTHVAGIVAAIINNSVGVAGISQVKIMSEKGLNQSGDGYADDLANAIVHAVDNGAEILTMSWGENSSNVLIQNALQYAYNSGALLVAAAGNDGSSQKFYPAAYDEVIAVSATDHSDNPAGFTNYGNWIELAAPGVNIFSTVWDNSYNYKSGTSMATPHVSGVAALVWSVFPELSRDELRNRLRETADDLGSEGFDFYYGYGRVNAKKAVQNLTLTHDIAVTNVSPRENVVAQGFGVGVEVNLTNQGDATESFNATLYANGTSVQTLLLVLTAGNSTKVTFTWNTTGVTRGDYVISAQASVVPGETDIIDNTKFSESPVTIVSLGHDVAIVEVALSKTFVGRGYSLSVNVLIKNYGSYTETFNFTTYANTIVIHVENVTLTKGNSAATAFIWNTTGFPYGNYSVSAYAEPVSNETATTDNTFLGGCVKVTIVGDVDGDRDVDVGDQRKVVIAMFTIPASPNWNPNVDVDSDLDVDVGDQRKQQLHMFESW